MTALRLYNMMLSTSSLTHTNQLQVQLVKHTGLCARTRKENKRAKFDRYLDIHLVPTIKMDK